MPAPTNPPPAANLNPSPKARFMQSGTRISNHRALIMSDAFEDAADAAMLQMQRAMANDIKDGNSAMAAGFRMLGAQEFLANFRLLAETPRAPSPPVRDNLNPNA